jgi:hypothetical protein
LSKEKDWVTWSRKLSLDATELAARVEIAQQHQHEAVAMLNDPEKGTPVLVAGAPERRLFLAGYASFEAGDAEAASAAFADVRRRLYGVEFPYHGDPVVYVESWFYMAEAALARGDQEAARAGYQAFLSHWGEATWELEALKRARRKVEALGGVTTPPQG